MSRAERLALIDRHDPALPVTRQCGLMTVSRSSVYRPTAPASDEDLAIMALIDRQYLARPYYGSRRMAAWLATQDYGSRRVAAGVGPHSPPATSTGGPGLMRRIGPG